MKSELRSVEAVMISSLPRQNAVEPYVNDRSLVSIRIHPKKRPSCTHSSRLSKKPRPQLRSRAHSSALPSMLQDA